MNRKIMMKNKLMLFTREQKEFESKINSLNLKDLEVIAPKNEQEVLENISQVNIIFGNPILSCNYINQANNIVWHQSSFA
jgi:hypothetical protein